MKNFSAEMIEKAKTAKSAEELLALAKENNVDMTATEAAVCFTQLNPKSGELDDDELDNVAGGACKSTEGAVEEEMIAIRLLNGQCCPNCGSTTARIDKNYYKSTYNTYVLCANCPTVLPEFLPAYQFEEIG